MNRFRRIAVLILCMALALQIAAVPAVADEVGEALDEIVNLENEGIVDKGNCGNNLSWKLSDDGVLTISGTGKMADWRYDEAPWFSNCDKIMTVVFDGAVTSIGKNAFNSCESLTSIEIPNGVQCI